MVDKKNNIVGVVGVMEIKGIVPVRINIPKRKIDRFSGSNKINGLLSHFFNSSARLLDGEQERKKFPVEPTKIFVWNSVK